MITRTFVVAIAILGIGVIVAMAAHRTPTAVACSGDPERFDDLVRAADVIAIVRAESVGGAVNTAPTIQPTFTPFPEATPQPYPLEDLSGMGATLRVGDVIAGASDRFIVVDAERRAVIETYEREREAVWPGLAVSCSVTFGTWSYEETARYIGLYRWAGSEFETMRLVKLDGDVIDRSGYLGLSLAAYERYFGDIPAEITDYLAPEGELDHAMILEPSIPVERFVAFIRSVRAEGISPPETGSGGLR